MNILIVDKSVIPVTAYGGTERVIWYLGKELTKLGHKISYLVKAGSACEFADILILDETKPIASQIPGHIDIVHFNFPHEEEISKPFLVTIHGNNYSEAQYPVNSVFVSANHAMRYHADAYVHNGLDWDDYGKPALDNKRDYFHFLGNAAWRLKNVKGAIDVVTRTPKEKLKVLGGTRLNLRMGFRFTWSPRVQFYGQVGGTEKLNLLQGSKGLVFPVKWNEPFGLAIIESLYFGCPVFGTPYGSLSELIHKDVGYLSANTEELSIAISAAGDYDKRRCHNYARDEFNSAKMAGSYLSLYEKVLNGYSLNKTRPYSIDNPGGRILPWQ